MALLDTIWESGLRGTGDKCSAYEAAACYFMSRDYTEKEVLDALLGSLLHPDKQLVSELGTVVDRVKRLVDIWLSFREITKIADSVGSAKANLVGAKHGSTESYMEYVEEQHPRYGRAAQAVKQQADMKRMQDGVLALAAIRWHAIRTRQLISRVGAGEKKEVDWFWRTFGEHHHLDAITFRNRLAHFDNLSPSELREGVDWFVEWLEALAAKIQRTSIGVPDLERNTHASFRTSEIQKLMRIEGDEISAANALVALTVVHPSEEGKHPVRFYFTSFDPDSRRVTFHGENVVITKARLS